MSRYRYPVLLVVLVVLTSLFVPLGIVGADSNTSTSTAEDVDGDLAVDTSAVDGTVELIVRLDDPDPAIVAASSDPVGTLQSQSSQAQQPLFEYADVTAGVEITQQFWITNAAVVEIDTDRVPIERLLAVEGVERVHENYEISVAQTASESADASPPAGPASPMSTTLSASTPSISSESYTYGLEQINVPAVWDSHETQGEGTTVAVLDSGVDTENHPDLQLASDGWADFVNDEPEPYDDNGHGTHVAGTVGGNQMTDGTHYGVAPETNMLHGKVVDGNGNGELDQFLDGMQWATEHNSGTDIITLSLGAESGFYLEDFIDPVRNANAVGITVVAASGNDGEGTSSSPGNVYDALSVGASDEDESIADFSNGEVIDTADAWGDDAPSDWPAEYTVPDVSAPGVGIVSAVPGGDYGSLSGTSMATPHVAGVVALMQSATDSHLSPDEVNSALQSTAVDINEAETRQGAGQIDAKAAVDAVTDNSESATFDITDINLPDESVTEGETVTVDVVVENTGDADGTQEIVLNVGADQDGTFEHSDVAAETVENLAPGQTETVSLSYDSQIGDAPAIDVQATSDDSERTETVSLESAESVFDITAITPQDSEITEGETVTVDVVVENTGDADGTQEIVLNVDANQDGEFEQSVVATETLEDLSPGQTETVSLSYDSQIGDAPAIDVQATSDDSERTETVSLESAESVFDITAITPQDNGTTEGETVTVDVVVENTGDADGTQEIVLNVDADQDGEFEHTAVASETITALAPGEIETVSLSYDSQVGDAPEIDLQAMSDDSVLSTTVLLDTAEPTMHPSGVTQKQFDAVDTNNNGEISLGELRTTVDSWSSTEQIDGVDITLGDIRKLVNWWSDNL